jgi:oxygen-independent coproporphyrinogen-3 oxidase
LVENVKVTKHLEDNIMVTKTGVTRSNRLSIITPELISMISRFDVPGPRYTSYPTSDRFVEAFTDEQYKQTLESRKIGGVALPLSLYIHIPFCESLCFYCACNKIITKQHSRATEYLQYLTKEIDMHTALLGSSRVVSQLHLGGGSPTFLNDEEITQLMDKIRSSFSLVPGGEYSIEIDPRTVDKKRLQHLASLGFNRLSFGVQDFDEQVQIAVHRIQPIEDVFNLVDYARQIGFESINVDLIYGLPKQTPRSFTRTISQVSKLIKPDRIALYAYAHLPERFKPQRHINMVDIPAAHEKVSMLSNAISSFLEAGYVYIGMDHFSLPQDELAVAKRQGRLHRNFQGYSTQPDCDLISLGVSAIGRVGATYSQNAKTLDEYYGYIDQGRFPIVRGLALTHDDMLRRAVIMAIMCQGSVDFESIESSYLIDFKNYFQKELQALKEFANDGMVEVEDAAINVTQLGWFFVRGIAMLFDRNLQVDNNRAKFSKII